MNHLDLLRDPEKPQHSPGVCLECRNLAQEVSTAEFVATIRLDNDAWRDPLDADALDFEALADAIRQIADKLDDFGTGGTVRDRNGNTSGTWALRS